MARLATHGVPIGGAVSSPVIVADPTTLPFGPSRRPWRHGARCAAAARAQAEGEIGPRAVRCGGFGDVA